MRRFILLITLLLFLSTPSLAQVAESYTCTDCFVDSNDLNVQTLTLTTFTVDTGSNLCLIAILHTRVVAGTVTANWDSAGTPQAMTEVGTGVAGTFAFVRVFQLANPAVGNLSMVFSWTGTGSVSTLGAVAFSGADCASAGNVVTATGSSTTPSTGAVTSTATGATVGAETSAGNDITAETLTPVYRNNTQSFQNAGVTYTLGNADNTHSWTIGSNTWGAIGFHIPAAAAAGGVGSLLMMGVGR